MYVVNRMEQLLREWNAFGVQKQCVRRTVLAASPFPVLVRLWLTRRMERAAHRSSYFRLRARANSRLRANCSRLVGLRKGPFCALWLGMRPPSRFSSVRPTSARISS